MGIICACLPAIRSLMRVCLPSVFGSTRQGTSSKLSTVRSYPTGSHIDDRNRRRSNGYDEIHKVALVDMNNSSEVRLAHGW